MNAVTSSRVNETDKNEFILKRFFLLDIECPNCKKRLEFCQEMKGTLKVKESE
jgi:hypothetical protein